MASVVLLVSNICDNFCLILFDWPINWSMDEFWLVNKMSALFIGNYKFPL